MDWLDRMKSLAGIRYTAPCRTCRVYVAYPKTWFDKVQNTRYLRCFLPVIVVVGRTLNTEPLNAAVSYPLTSDYTQAKPDLEYITQE